VSILRVPSRLGLLAATLVAVIAAIHFQQYVSFISEVPKIGVLFLLNAAGGAGLVIALLSPDRTLRLLAAVGGIGLAAGSLVSIALALSSSFLGYREPTLRLPIVLAIIAEALAIPTLGLLALRERRGDSANPVRGLEASSHTRD
jgi:hypothetical protein